MEPDKRRGTPSHRINRQSLERRRGIRRAAPSVFDRWAQVESLLRSASRLALFLDLDGTLVELCPRPGDVPPLDLELRKILRNLAAHPKIHVYVISGRGLSDLRRLVPVRGVQLLGLHGWEGRAVPPMVEERLLLRQARHQLEERLRGNPHIRLEDKGLAVAVHYRGAPSRILPKARAIVRAVLQELGPRIHLLRGHKIWEFLPSRINGKGSAVESLLSKLPDSTFPIFIGDDVTDESAFLSIPRGLSIRVGTSCRTNARFRLRNPKEVKAFLLRVAAEKPGVHRRKRPIVGRRMGALED